MKARGRRPEVDAATHPKEMGSRRRTHLWRDRRLRPGVHGKQHSWTRSNTVHVDESLVHFFLETTKSELEASVIENCDMETSFPITKVNKCMEFTKIRAAFSIASAHASARVPTAHPQHAGLKKSWAVVWLVSALAEGIVQPRTAPNPLSDTLGLGIVASIF